MCVSEDSEALTDKGWRSLLELDGTEKFAVLDPQTQEMFWEVPSKLSVFDREGDMVHFSNQTTDHLVTPEHDVYMTARSSYSKRDQPWQKRKAKDAPNYPYWKALNAAREWTGTHPDFIHIPDPSKGTLRGFDIPIKLAAQLFGWYVAEGSTAEGDGGFGTRVTISQSAEKSPDECFEIKTLLDSIGLSYSQTFAAFRINNRPLSEFLSEHFGTRGNEIHIPEWLFAWNKELLTIFLNAYLRGDGTPNTADTTKTVLDASNAHARTSSQRLADGMMRLGIQLGITVRHGAWRDFPFAGTEYVGRAMTISFTRRQQSSMGAARRVPYKGKVWCPTVSTGVWCVRRNGKALWTGNSNDRLDSLPSQPLGALGRMEHVTLLHKAQESAPGMLPVYGIEYLQDWRTLPARLTKFGQWAEENFPPTQPLFIGLHAPIFPDTKTPPYEHIHGSQIGKLLVSVPNPVTVGYGHIHDPEGHWAVTDTVTIANYGGISRGSLHAETVKRQPRVYVWDSETGEIDPFDIPVKPPEEVFNFSEVQAQADKQEKMTDFLKEVGSTELHSYDSVDTLLEKLYNEVVVSTETDSETSEVFKIASELVEKVKYE